jgi:hypothetical protein
VSALSNPSLNRTSPRTPKEWSSLLFFDLCFGRPRLVRNLSTGYRPDAQEHAEGANLSVSQNTIFSLAPTEFCIAQMRSLNVLYSFDRFSERCHERYYY